jgi:hypothetical protein
MRPGWVTGTVAQATLPHALLPGLDGFFAGNG